MISDMSANLFQRAIAFSGVGLDPWAIPPISNFAERLGQVLGFNGTTEAQLLDFLERAPAAQLVGAKNYVVTQEEKYGQLVDVVVGPIIEPTWSRNPFLTKDPVIAARTAWSNRIDAIIGANSFEGLFQAFKEWADNIDLYIQTFNSNPAYFAPLASLKLNASSPQAQAYGQRIKNLYFNNATGFTRDTLLQFYKVTLEYCQES
jgi:carboxylesterase type B